MTERRIFTIGGTVQASGGLYITRYADTQLLDLCRRGQLAYVLTARQVGKSSLMVHTAEQLSREGIATAIVDLSLLGVQGVTPEQWYLGVITSIADQLSIENDPLDWWQRHDHLGLTQRMIHFFENVVLAEAETRAVMFFDEIDSTLSLPFTDDFYAAIRAIYNNRATTPAFQRLTFVLIGVANPGDLISDPSRTPFNIGERVHLHDFTLEEILPLSAGLNLSPEKAERVLRRVHYWTGGHPYLTQRLCSNVAKQDPPIETEEEVDQLVEITFCGEQSDKDSNLQFVRDMLIKRPPDRAKALTIYRKVLHGHPPVHDSEQSIHKVHLRLSGIVLRINEMLAVRNRIYSTVFDRSWIKHNMPINWARWATLTAVSVVVVLVALVLFAVQQTHPSEVVVTPTPSGPDFFLVNPVARTFTILDRFDTPRSYTFAPNKKQLHQGIDLRATDEQGNPVAVLAAQRGIVKEVGFSQFSGNYVRISHQWHDGTWVTWYAHLSAITVEVNKFVLAGEQIGIAGTTGFSTGIHLCLTLQHIGQGLTGYVIDDVVDPEPFFKLDSVIVFDEASFVADVTVPDGIQMKPGQKFTKIWRVRNTGTTTWDTDYTLAFWEGDQMGGPDSVSLPPAKPGETVDVAITLEAPTDPGLYRSAWKGRAPDSEFFEYEMYTLIEVFDPNKLFDMLPYIRGDGRVYELEFNWSGGGIQRVQTQIDGDRFYHVKGSEWEELWADEYFIYRGMDTSPGGGEVYILTEDDRYGSPWIPRQMPIRAPFRRSPLFQFYDKTTGQRIPGKQGTLTSWIVLETIEKSHKFPSGIELEDVAVLAAYADKGGHPDDVPFERYYYARGYGLVAWEGELGTMSIIREFSPGEVPDLERESISWFSSVTGEDRP